MDRDGCHDRRAILFDFGGTLDSDGHHWLHRFFALYEEVGLSIPRPAITSAFYHAVDTCYADPRVAAFSLRRLLDHQVVLQFQALQIKDRAKEKEIARRFREQSEACLHARVHLLKRMKGSFRLGIVSNFYGNLGLICADAGLEGLLEVIIDSNRVGVRKPDAAIFTMALANLGLAPDKVVFVGDSYERDMIPAKRLGMETVWLRRSPPFPDPSGCVDHTIVRLSSLEGLVL
jgi:HAD superfamily hydrolase (TIGR01509 family)